MLGGVRTDAWLPVLPRVIGLAVVVAVLPLVHGLHWDATVWVLAALVCGAWASWCVLGARAGQPESVPEARAVPLLLVPVVAGNLLVMLRPEAGIAAIVVGMAVMSVGAALPTRSGIAVLTAGILAVGVGAALSARSIQIWAVVGWSSLLLAGYLAGTVRRGLHVQHREERRAAALAERTRIAREIHDVLAHSLGALAVQLDLTDSLLTADPPRTAEAIKLVADARRIAVDGLVETRRAIATLRSDTPPLPEALTAMVSEHRTRSGASASLDVEGTPRPLAPDVTLALLRVTQEALANAAKHAPRRPVTARLRYEPDSVDLSVLSRGAGTVAEHDPEPQPEPETELEPGPEPEAVPGLNGGYGLAGMRERLLLVGGELRAGPSAAGWHVHAHVAA
ncbi:signal transduction histidine kinase [Catenulispora sp. EB89]|uniref:sensor histidine kinase n=1 Tax=Catenulispora sp. EB89 TaxID=3156257 RepID=UPI003514DBA5